jgi:hypothetical protein
MCSDKANDEANRQPLQQERKGEATENVQTKPIFVFAVDSWQQ